MNTTSSPKKPKRNRHAIRAWLVGHNITNASISKAVNVSNALVCSTIGGTRNNRKVLQHLIKLAVPVKYLALPADMLATGGTP